MGPELMAKRLCFLALCLVGMLSMAHGHCFWVHHQEPAGSNTARALCPTGMVAMGGGCDVCSDNHNNPGIGVSQLVDFATCPGGCNTRTFPPTQGTGWLCGTSNWAPSSGWGIAASVLCCSNAEMAVTQTQNELACLQARSNGTPGLRFRIVRSSQFVTVGPAGTSLGDWLANKINPMTETAGWSQSTFPTNAGTCGKGVDHLGVTNLSPCYKYWHCPSDAPSCPLVEANEPPGYNWCKDEAMVTIETDASWGEKAFDTCDPSWTMDGNILGDAMVRAVQTYLNAMPLSDPWYFTGANQLFMKQPYNGVDVLGCRCTNFLRLPQHMRVEVLSADGTIHPEYLDIRVSSVPLTIEAGVTPKYADRCDSPGPVKDVSETFRTTSEAASIPVVQQAINGVATGITMACKVAELIQSPNAAENWVNNIKNGFTDHGVVGGFTAITTFNIQPKTC